MPPPKRPSDNRRQALRNAENESYFPSSLSNLRAIDSYYSIADKVLAAFEECYSKKQLDDAYIYGRRFAKFSMESLPTHDYYKSPKKEHVMLRKKNVRDVENVMVKLERVAEMMDAEEVLKQQQLLKQQQPLKKEDVELSAMQKLEMLRAPSGFKNSSSTSSVLGPPPPLPEPILPPPIPPPPSAPPAYDDIIDNSQYNPSPPPKTTNTPSIYMNGVGDAALPSLYHLSFASNQQPSAPILPPPMLPTTTPSAPSSALVSAPVKKFIPVRKLQSLYMEKFELLKRQKKIEIFYLSTYQGRIQTPSRDSTNGCTVISPLVAATHLDSPGSGIPDMKIEQIIDNDAPPILNAVRSKLGLAKSALIVPSDVHDYLVDCKILHQERFVGVCGGNILEEEHMGEFLGMLQSGTCGTPTTNGNDNNDYGGGGGTITYKKVAAALFFHEHVISILKLTVSNQKQCWFDVVDSLPSGQYINGRACCSRTRCKDRHSLEVFLKKYACLKFSESNCAYIDRNKWDDVMADFDPRVFQAFVWKE